MATDVQLPTANGPSVVQMRYAKKSFINTTSKKSFKVFSDLSLTVPSGKIYSLLGPSGCGKTTLLRCIVGRETLDTGHVLVFGSPPGTKGCGVPGRNVGYMPQETCVFDTMTIAECFKYYGAILGLSKDKIQARIKYYEKILKLPSVNTVTVNLSGGQGRRVSFAIALFHHPKLIVLDEPTVGIDPIVKSYMWKHLLELTNTKKISIILTTHYIEEARQSHVVGMMHGGRMAAEDSPENLISKLNCQSLEDVSLRICFQGSNERAMDTFNDPNQEKPSTNTCADIIWIPQETTVDTSKIGEAPESNPKVKQRSSCLSSSDFTVRWRPLQSIIVKYILFLIRFPGGLIFLLCLPAFIIIIFHLTMQSSIKDVNIIVVNEDRGELGKAYLTMWDQNALAQTNYSSLQDAKLALHDGKAYGILHVGQNFSEMLLKRIDRGPFASEEVLTKSKLNMSVIDINFHIAMFVTYRLYTSLQKLLQTIINTSFVDSPIVFNKDVYDFLENPSMKAVTIPVVVVSMYYAATASSVMILFVEMNKGYLDRSFVAGTTIAELVSGLMLVEFMMVSAQSFITLVILLSVYEGVSVASWILIFLLTFAAGVSGTAYGMFISLAFPNINQLVMIAASCSILAGAVTGAFWPLEAMPVFFKYCCYISPLVYPVKAFKIIMSNTWHLFYGQVLLGFTALFIWFLLCILASLRFLHLLK